MLDGPTFILILASSAALFLVMAIRILQAVALRKSAHANAPSFADPIKRSVLILKPLKGVDPGLEDNLESLFQQEHSRFSIVLGARDSDDPALEVARKVCARHPDSPRSIVISSPHEVGPNPKVSNLENLRRQPEFQDADLFLISDSNVRVDPGYLGDLVWRYRKAGCHGLVWSLFRGTGESGLGGALEALQVNTFVMGGMAAMVRFTPGALGKSMLIGREDLDSVGGFLALSRYMAEDQVLAEEIAARGLPVVMSNHLVDNVIGRRSYMDFVRRHLRWATLRRHMKFGGYFVEIPLNPVFVAGLGALLIRTRTSGLVFLTVLSAVSLLDFWVERLAGVRRNLASYPFLELLLGLSKGILWFVPFFGRRVSWRGNSIRIGPRTRINPSSDAQFR